MQANNQRFDSQHTNRLSEMLPATRPSDLLPWADPYIARLVTKLQDEVRDERTQTRKRDERTQTRIRDERTQTRKVSRIAGNCLAELEPPSPSTDNDWDWDKEPRWSLNDEQ